MVFTLKRGPVSATNRPESVSTHVRAPILARLVLIITIISMVLISIQPFAFRKIFLLVGTLLCLSSALCFADSLFMSLHSTPSYGRQLSRSQVAPLSIPEKTVQSLPLVGGQSLDYGFAQDAGWTISTFVLDPTIDWLQEHPGAIGDRPHTPLCTYAGSRKYDAASSGLYAGN
jgi:hypothetical protein